MSYSPGFISKGDQIIGYFLFHDTVESAISDIYSSRYEIWEKFEENRANNFLNVRHCICKQAPEEVILCRGYEPEIMYYWPAKVCFNCRAIVETFSPYEDLPLDSGWPKNGLPPGITADAIKTSISNPL